MLRLAPLVRRSELALDGRELIPATPELTSGQRRMLQAALVVFADRGFGGARVRDIADVAGVQPGNLYNHFPSKYEMLGELATLGHQEALRRQTLALLDCRPDPRDQLAAIVRAIAVCNMTYPELSKVVSHELGHLSDEALAPSQACYEQALTIVEEVAQRGLDAGIFAVNDLHIAMLAAGSLGRDSPRWFHAQSIYTMDQVADELVIAVLRMFGCADR